MSAVEKVNERSMVMGNLGCRHSPHAGAKHKGTVQSSEVGRESLILKMLNIINIQILFKYND